jgi:DNA repair exonuclease SbcCD ATPase subunit
MSITNNSGIEIPTEQLNRANKSTLIQIIKSLTDELSSVKSEVSEVNSELSSIREDVSTISRRNAQTRKKQDERITELEENADTDVSQSSEGQSSPDEGQGQGSDSQSTALEQVVGLPDDVAMNSLSANQKRARSIAQRVDEYGKSVPAGIAITSSRMRDILSGLEDKRVHRQTVQRVMDFLKRFGDGHIDTKETRGGKTVTVFSETVVENITSVVTGQTRDGVTPTII